VPEPDEGQTASVAAALPLDGELVGLGPAELQHLGGLADGQEGGKVIQHGSPPVSVALHHDEE